MSQIRTAEELDQAMLERQALEEIAEVARRYIPKLVDGQTRRALIRLESAAPPARQQAA